MQILNIHILDPKNAGDCASAPFRYFNTGAKEIGIQYIEGQEDMIRDSAVIVGGGGMIWQCEGQMDLLADLKPRKLISWGMGHNVDCMDMLGKYPRWMDSYNLHGIRDWNSPYTWVPCASCMSPLFDRKYDIKHEAVIYTHGIVEIPDMDKLPKLSNLNCSMSEAVPFIGSGSVVITNSYHGIYWATLLKRNVLIYRPFSTRFYTSRYKHPTLLTKDWRVRLSKPIIYETALDECRRANVAHYNKVMELISE